jgi:hemerythrin
LGNYVVKHFADEEAVQVACGYPDYPYHKKLHENYTAAVMDFAAQWMAAGPCEKVLREIRIHVGGWLINHIKAHDVRIGAYIRSLKDKK